MLKVYRKISTKIISPEKVEYVYDAAQVNACWRITSLLPISSHSVYFLSQCISFIVIFFSFCSFFFILNKDPVL